MEKSDTSIETELAEILRTVDLLQLIKANGHPARVLHYQLRARSLPSPFTASDLVRSGGPSRRTAYRNLAEWRKARLVTSEGWERKRLPFKPRFGSHQKNRPDRDRRGRPAKRYQFVDPLASAKPPGPTELRALAAQLREPSAMDSVVLPLRQALRLLTSREGRDFLRNQVGPVLPKNALPSWVQSTRAFVDADPITGARLRADWEAHLREVLGKFLPQIADLVDWIANVWERDPVRGRIMLALFLHPERAGLRSSAQEPASLGRP